MYHGIVPGKRGNNVFMHDNFLLHPIFKTAKKNGKGREYFGSSVSIVSNERMMIENGACFSENLLPYYHPLLAWIQL
jgi:hypothetical protein